MAANEKLIKDFAFIQTTTGFDYLLHMKCRATAEASNETAPAEGHSWPLCVVWICVELQSFFIVNHRLMPRTVSAHCDAAF